MSKPKLVGLLASIIGIVLLMAILNSGNQTPYTQWASEGYQNLAFSIGWLTRAPSWLAYVLAVVVFLLVTVAFNLLGQWLYRKAKH